MTQPNDVGVLDYITADDAPDIELDLDDEDLDDDEDGLEVEGDAKGGKARASKRRAQAKKKHYTEDSIRLYLQEIGRIRLLRAPRSGAHLREIKR
jgi:RNA polymerase primary sigma factor